MKKTALFILAIALSSCASAPKDTADWSGTIVQNDQKTEIVLGVMKAYVENNLMESSAAHFAEAAEVFVNDAKLTFEEMATAFAQGHMAFDNIAHTNVTATTMYYNNGKVFTNTWYDWSGTSKATGEEVKLKGYCAWGWKDDKISYVYNAFDPTAYNNAIQPN